MTEDRWQEVKGKVLDTFSDATTGNEQEGVERIEWVEFQNPEGKRMRLEWHDSPKKIGEKTITSKRVGSQVAIEPEYSSDERVQRIDLLIFDEQARDWKEGDASSVV